jgi:hypothetical protein
MRCSIFSACGILIITLAVAGYTEGQGKKKLPALAFDAKFVKFEDKKGLPTKLYYEASEDDSKKLGFMAGNTPITKGTKFVFVGPDGEKTFTQKTVLADEDAKKHLQKESKIRVQVTGVEVEELRFGPNLKPEGIKRVR